MHIDVEIKSSAWIALCSALFSHHERGVIAYRKDNDLSSG